MDLLIKKSTGDPPHLRSLQPIIIIIHEYYYGGAVALLLQDHLTMSVTEQSQYLSATVQREHKTCNSAETTYTTSPDQIDGMKLEI